jgi:hypothetical protein
VSAGAESISDLARRHVDAAVAEGAARGRTEDAVARALLGAVIEVYLRGRGADDVRRELEFVAEHVGGDDDFPFMRP